MHVIHVGWSSGKWSHCPFLVVPWPDPRENVALVLGSWHWCLLCDLPGCQSDQGCSRSVCYKVHFKLIIGHHHPPTQCTTIHKFTIEVPVAMALPPWTSRAFSCGSASRWPRFICPSLPLSAGEPSHVTHTPKGILPWPWCRKDT